MIGYAVAIPSKAYGGFSRRFETLSNLTQQC